MAWNEPGNGKDPWNKDNRDQQNMDEIVMNWQRKINRILGGGGGGGGQSSVGTLAILAMLFVAWMLTGLYRVDQAERGVVQRFGAYTKTTLPGLRWHLPYPIELVDIVNVENVFDYQFKTEMLTADEQYVLVDMAVQYRISDPVRYSFEVEDPEVTLKDVTESALRGVVGTSSLEQLIGERREQIPDRTEDELQQTLTSYSAGLDIQSINLKRVDYPENVKEAVDDTQRAGNDKERTILEAQTYRNNIIPRARGAAQRIQQDAEAYRDRVIADAEGEAARFEALLSEYQKAPRVTRDRLYIEAIEQVYGNSSKVIMDTDGSGNLLYLPVDRLIEQQQRRVPPGGNAPGSSGTSAAADPSATSRDTSRQRRTRQ